ncbi:DUF2332 domain-containing protein [Nocardioides gilvus]|uniref:DUF2332 domain-containing protein n=1 Tax=Nocardioides gilvus TaxID=1735589 RepID=UPI000D74149D|nr:DUF2332 domain-containing protein [Nocardioides gilvus]
MKLFATVDEEYADFAAYAADESPSLAAWARAVPADPETCAWLESLPVAKRQPNLVFAALRRHGADARDGWDVARGVLLERLAQVEHTVQSHATQTNEVGRLTSLMPLLGAIEGPVALLEAGASAGLCLYPDRYDYRWQGAGELRGSGGPLLECRASGPVPVPTRWPEVAWRGGVDLNPLDVDDPDDVDWLEALVWPEQDERRDRLARAVEIARADPAHLHRGDLLETLPALVEQAATYGTVVLFHSAVIAYLEPADRLRFDEMARGLVAAGACRWISNEGPDVLPSVTGQGRGETGQFVLGLDGEPVAWSHGHGRSLTWL